MSRHPRVLAATILGVASLSSGPSSTAAPTAPQRLVVVIFGGGVRSRELLGRPDLCPTVRAIGNAGFAWDGWAVAGADPTDATKGILTGRRVAPSTPGRTRPTWPTLFEYVRKGLGLPAEAVWYASYADGEALDLAASDHASWGARYAASGTFGEGPFGDRLRAILSLLGRPNPTTERTWSLLASLREVSSRESARHLPAPSTPTAAERQREERALLEEVDRRSRDFSGPASLDARAVRAGISVLRLFRPRLLVIRLGQADVARQDLAAYWDVLRRNDAEIAKLRAAIAEDPALAGSTALLVTGDVGRDATQNAAGGFDREDASPERTTVAVVGEGPGFRRGAVPKSPRDARDLCPTCARLLGVATPHAEGRVREDLLTAP